MQNSHIFQIVIRCYSRAVIFCLLAVLSSVPKGHAAPGPRTAVVYSDWAQGAGKEIDRPAFKALGWSYDGWENTKLPEMVAQLSRYDMVVFAMCYNFSNAQNFGAYAKEWKSFLERGGIMFVMDFENDPPNGLTWLAQSDPRFLILGGGKPSPYAQKTPEWTADHPLMKGVDGLRLCWTHWDYVSPYYTPLVRDGAWRPQLALQEVGDGVLIVSTLYAQTSFPPSTFLDNLWKFTTDPVRRAKHRALEAKMASAPAAAVSIPKLSGRPNLDDDTPGKAWRQGAPLRFSTYDGSSAGQQEGGRIGSFGSDVYFFVSSNLTDRVTVAGDAGRDEVNSQLHDKIEILVESSEGSGAASQRRFVVNANGVLYDEQNADPAWSRWWQARTRADGKEWTAAIQLPLSTLVPDMTASTKWKINIARYRAGGLGTVQNADWLVPTFSTSAWPERLGQVRSNLAPQVGLAGVPVDLPAEYIQGVNNLQFHFTNPRNTVIKGELTVVPVEAGNKVSGATAVILPKGSTRVSLPLMPDGLKPVRYQAVLKSGENILYSTPIISGTVLEYMDAALVQPSYRGIIQSKDPAKWVEVSSTVRTYERSTLELSASVTQEGGGLVVAQQKTYVEKAGIYQALKCEAATWKPGKYSVKVVLAKAGGKGTLSAQSFGFEILPPAPTEITFAENGSSYVNGKPFFPIGLYNIEQYQLGTSIKFGERETMAEVKKHGFNVGITCDGVPSDARMTMADEIGLYLSPTPFGITRQTMSDYVAQANRHPSVLFWYGSDEMEGEQVDRSIADYKVMRELDPHRPVISAVQNFNPHVAERVHQALDIMMPDFYPIPSGSLTRIADGTELSLKFNRHNRAWVVPQAFAGMDMFPRVPSKEEIRCQAYIAITHGAKGLFWYSYGNKILTLKDAPSGYWFLPDFPDQWNAFTRLNAEVTSLAPAILKGKVIAVAGLSEGIHVRALDYEGKTYVMAVNGTNAAIDAKLTIPGAAGKFDVLNENRKVTGRAETIQDRFGPLEAHIYIGE